MQLILTDKFYYEIFLPLTMAPQIWIWLLSRTRKYICHHEQENIESMVRNGSQTTRGFSVRVEKS